MHTPDSVFGAVRMAEFEENMRYLMCGEDLEDDVAIEMSAALRNGAEFVLESLDGRGGIAATMKDGKLVYRAFAYRPGSADHEFARAEE